MVCVQIFISSGTMDVALVIESSRLSFQTAPKACDSDGCAGHWKNQSHKICWEFVRWNTFFLLFFHGFHVFRLVVGNKIFLVTWLIAVGWKMLQHAAPVDIPNPIPRLIRLISCRQSVIPKPFTKPCWLNMYESMNIYVSRMSSMAALLNFRFCFSPPQKKKNCPSIPSPLCKEL